MSDLMERFRAFQARWPAAPPPPPPAAAPVLPAGRWEDAATPLGAVPVRTDRLPLAGADPLAGPWPARVAAADLGPHDGWRWLDLETTGLGPGSGTRAFLVGIARLDGDGLAVRQFLLAGPEREPALLWAVGRELGRAPLITFNGKSFDWPLLRDRFVVAGQPPPRPRAHWDLLHPARRLWGPSLPGGCDLCALQTAVLGRPRRGDVPGERIPACYLAWLDGAPAALDGVCAHNREDLHTLAQLAARMCADLATGPAAEASAPRLYGLGRLYEKVGAREPAVACYLAGGAPSAAAALLKRLGRAAEAVPIWESQRRGRVPSVQAAVELAKYLEHRAHDPGAALAVVRDALRPGPWLTPGRRAALEHRLGRLRRKAAARSRRRAAEEEEAGPLVEVRGGPQSAEVRCCP